MVVHVRIRCRCERFVTSVPVVVGERVHAVHVQGARGVAWAGRASTVGLIEVVDLLACPVCGGPIQMSGDRRSVVCSSGHAADLARQGYVTLVRDRARYQGDTTAMVMARERVQAAALFAAVAEAVVTAIPSSATTVLELGAGTGYYLSQVVNAVHERRGIALDISKAALRRAARVHHRIGAVGADLTAQLPIRDGAIDVCVVVFAPRNAAAVARVLAVDGLVVVVTPRPGHLAEIAGPLGMLTVPAGKVEELATQFSPGFRVRSSRRVRHDVSVRPEQTVDLALMGPAGFHTSAAEVTASVASVPTDADGKIEVSIDVDVTTFALD